MNNHLQVAAFQGYIQEGNSKANLEKILEQTLIAEQRGIDILVFPECYLHGYFTEENDAITNSIDLHSYEFNKLCKQFSSFQHTTVIFGLNEIEQENIYNTVVVIEKGECIGKYRKAYTYVPYNYYSVGREFPVFEKKGIKYGIIICLDSAYREPAHIVALKGARIIFCPMFNRIPKDPEMIGFANKMYRRKHFTARAFDNHCWFITSDIVWNDEKNVCPGFSCIVNDSGEFISKAEPFQETLLSYSIPLEVLKIQKKMRLRGNPELFEIVKKTYAETT